MRRTQLTPEWSFEVNADFRHRIEDEALVFWRPQQTIWIIIYNIDITQEEVLSSLKEDAHPHPAPVFESNENNLLKYAYLLPNEDAANTAWGLTAFCVAQSSYALMAMYFDDKEMLDWALACLKSVNYQS
jgi:hypothetical protein